jgi:hypothetical protein
VPLPTFGLETILQVPSTVVVGPWVGVLKGAEVDVGVWIGATVAVGVRVLLGAACTASTGVPGSVPVKATMSSTELNTISDLFRYFQFAFIVLLPVGLRGSRRGVVTWK